MNNVIITLLIFCNVGCVKLGEHTAFIEVQNYSSDTIRCFANYNYPDTSLPMNKPSLQRVEPQGYTKLESKNLENISSKDTFMVFIFNEDTVNKYSWDVIRNNYKVLKRYNLTLEKLQNGKLTYP